MAENQVPPASGEGPTGLRRGAIRMAGRAGWALLDQGISSFTNFALGVLIARSVAAIEFGAFSLAFSTYIILLNLARAVGTQPLVIRYSGVDPATWRRGAAAATGTTLVMGAGSGALCLVIGSVVGGTAGATFIALGIALPALLLQDAWRFVFFAGARDRDAVLTDFVWAVSLVGVLILVESAGSVPLEVIGWGVSTLIAALVGSWRSGVVPNPFATKAWIREHADLVGRYSAEVIVSLGSSQAAIYVVGLTAGLAEAGSIRAAQILLGPMHVVLQAAHLIAVPEGVRIRQRSPGRFQLAIVGLSIGLAVVIMSWVITLSILPAEIGQFLLGDSWASARVVLIPLGIALAAQGVSGGALVGLRVLADASGSLRARLLDATSMLFFGVSGGLLGGAIGAAWGFAIAGAVGAAIFHGAFFRSERRHRGIPQAGSPQPAQPEINPADEPARVD
jgi:O-antigen/teichoic acid export membrane protein